MSPVVTTFAGFGPLSPETASFLQAVTANATASSRISVEIRLAMEDPFMESPHARPQDSTGWQRPYRRQPAADRPAALRGSRFVRLENPSAMLLHAGKQRSRYRVPALPGRGIALCKVLAARRHCAPARTRSPHR